MLIKSLTLSLVISIIVMRQQLICSSKLYHMYLYCECNFESLFQDYVEILHDLGESGANHSQSSLQGVHCEASVHH